jgi:hypothetical protein
MKGPTLPEGVAFALLASLAGSILLTALAGTLPSGLLLRLLLAAFGGAYVVYLLWRSRERVGRIVVAMVWIGVAATALWLSVPMPFYVLIHAGLIWLVRALYHHSSLFPALADLCLLGFGLATALWAFVHTGTVFLGVWCFFLVQSLFVLIPSSLNRRRNPQHQRWGDEERFDCAHRNAETALRDLHSIH